MGYISDNLNKIDNTKEDVKNLYDIFNSIDDFKIPIIRFFLGAGEFVLRQRLNEKGKEFIHIHELTYPQDNLCKHYGRANIPYHSMFYCCCQTPEEGAIYPRLLSLMETSKILKDKESKGIERSTLSKWKVTQRLELLMMPFRTSYARPNPMIKQIQKEWEEGIKKSNVDPNGLELVYYMSDELAKDTTDEYGYFKIANYIYYLLYINNKTRNADGIIYPSIPSAGEGFNIALKPTSVDSKLKFDMASLTYLYKNGEHSYYRIVNHSKLIDKIKGLIFEPMPNDVIEDIKLMKYQGLDFIN